MLTSGKAGTIWLNVLRRLELGIGWLILFILYNLPMLFFSMFI